MFAHSWRANIHPQGRSRPAQLQDGLKRAWWVAIKLRNLPAKSVKNVDSRTGKQMEVLEIPMYLFSFYSFTGIDSHFARNGLLGLIGHSSRVKDPLSLSLSPVPRAERWNPPRGMCSETRRHQQKRIWAHPPFMTNVNKQSRGGLAL